MKHKRFFRISLALACAAALAVPVVGQAGSSSSTGGSRTFYATDDQGRLLSFSADNPRELDSVRTLTGLPSGVNLRGIDFRPATGDLYGVHTPHASDRELDKTADQESFVDSEMGENWLETLGKKAAEYGAEAEEELEVVDNSDELGGHHSTESGDRPVADKGSGGRGGM